MKSYKELHKQALEIQDACNLSGVVDSFSDAMTELWRICKEQNLGGTKWVNSNSVTRLYASKISSLAGELRADDIGIDDIGPDDIGIEVYFGKNK